MQDGISIQKEDRSTIIDGIYIIKENGICLASLDNGRVTEMSSDLMSPFLTALDAFTNENFKANIKCIILDDETGQEKRVYFKGIKINGYSFKMVAIFSKHIGFPWRNFGEIDAKFLKFKWALQEKGWARYLSSDNVPVTVLKEIRAKIGELFNMR
ncbi:MAG: hypothetical protein ACFFCS_06695 [Candidatus Hodarchaeota archaeon]